MKRIFVLIWVSLVLCLNVEGQPQTLYTQNFDGVIVPALPSDWSTDGVWATSSSSASSGYTGASGVNNVSHGSTAGLHYLTFSGVSTTGYNNITVLWGARKSPSTSTLPLPAPSLEYSTDGSTWINVPYTDDVPFTNTWSVPNAGVRISLPSGAFNQAILQLRFKLDQTTTGTVRVDDFNIQGDIITSVGNASSPIVKKFSLSQNYPNPFNPTTNITFALAKDEFVSLKVYDMLGKEIATLVNGKQSAGAYTVPFNATSLPSGIYFYTLRAGNNIETKKMLLVK